MSLSPPVDLPRCLVFAFFGAFALHAAETEFKHTTSRSVAVNRSPETPEYVGTLTSDIEWLDFGVQSRTRYESRWNDYQTPSLITDDALVTRNLVYFSTKHALDPLRFVVEMEDSRRFFTDRPDVPNVINEWELLQAYVQLHFDNVIGGQSLSLSVGRMSFDAIDRRLVERTRNRNSMTAFDGVRLRVGDETSPWEFDAFALRHVDRNINQLDESSHDSTLYGLTAYLRDLAPRLVLEPYWLWLDQRGESDPALQRSLHTYGVHAFGQWGERSAWDYDVSLAGQFGEASGLDHRAAAAHLEAGYTWQIEWKPRFALWFNYATGDRNANDAKSQRFDSLYGDNYSFYSYASYFTWQNTINPALRLSFQPVKKLKCELIHRAIWLASNTDAWIRADRRDPTGSSGSYIGQETDARIIWQVCENFDLDLAYAHFFPGSFVDNTGASPASDFIQIAATVQF